MIFPVLIREVLMQVLDVPCCSACPPRLRRKEAWEPALASRLKLPAAQIAAKRACRVHDSTARNGRGNVIAKVLIECPGVMLSLSQLTRDIALQKNYLDVDCAAHYILL
jgi:hypothetical protein